MKGYFVIKKQSQDGSAHLILVIVLVIALIGSLGFIFWQNYTQKQDMTASPTEITTPTEITPAPVVAETLPTTQTIADIKAAISSKNVTTLENKLADSVSVIPVPGGCEGEPEVSYSIESCFRETKAQAFVSLTDLVNGNPGMPSPSWDFDISAEKLASYKASNSFLSPFIDKTNAIIGVSEISQQMIIINFDSTGKINTILQIYQF